MKLTVYPDDSRVEMWAGVERSDDVRVYRCIVIGMANVWCEIATVSTIIGMGIIFGTRRSKVEFERRIVIIRDFNVVRRDSSSSSIISFIRSHGIRGGAMRRCC